MREQSRKSRAEREREKEQRKGGTTSIHSALYSSRLNKGGSMAK